jgi:hypothetical protein
MSTAADRLARAARSGCRGSPRPRRLTEATDAQGRPFAIVTLPKRRLHTIVFTADPDGAALVDPDDVDMMVARWGAWLANLGDEPGIVAVSVTVETVPDSGERLRRELDATTRPDAPAICADMLGEVAQTYPSGSATVKAMIAVTFRGARGRYQQDTARDLAGRAAHLAGGLHGTGAGGARPMSAQELAEAIRCAYDPAAQATFDDARAQGTVAELDWHDVGPAAAEASYGSYGHDGAASVTWAMTQAPRGNVPSDVLARLLRPHPDVDRKRVALLYRPLDSARAARVVEGDHRDAEATVRNAKRPTSRMLTEQKSAAATAQEEAQGAGLLSFAMLITATVTDPERLPAARRAVEQLAPTSTDQDSPGLRGAGGGVRGGPAARRRPGRAPAHNAGQGGTVTYVEAPPEWRGTSVQLCGLFPYSAGAGAPMLGVPVGRHLVTGATLCCDPINVVQHGRN